ncbi:MAG TPA: Crp/Fnr family transcriptional regulator [Burkholderiales bacterium]|nr:Crp/Fnr family transcriptional regulator [Burkholderiales bacterium]
MDAATLRQELLARFPVFGSVSREALERVLASGRTRTLRAGSLLFDTGKPCTGFPLLLSGTVRVAKAAPNGREVRLYRVQPGEACIMSTGCLLGEVDYSATGIAESDVVVFVLPPALFTELMAREEAFRKWVFGLFSERLSGMMELVEAVTFQHLDRRLAAFLARRGPLVVASQQQLADELGTVREIVGRLLRSFEDRGLVELGRGQVRVVDAAGLAAIAGEPR